jgi:NAD(P)-dependent dehydrogenase (short-subunit alcohol dehydrogenase family)
MNALLDKRFGRIDVLVNNAGVTVTVTSTETTTRP